MMRHILILRELTNAEIENVHSLAKEKDTLVISNAELQNNFDFAKPLNPLTEEEKKTINYQTLSEVLEFGDTIVDGKPITEHFNYQGAGLWYYHKFRIYFSVRNQNYATAEIDKNLIGASSAILYLPHRAVDAQHYAQSPFKIVLPEPSKKESIALGSIVAYGFTAVLRWLISVLTPLYCLKKKKVLCIDTTDQYRDILSLEGTGKIFENAYLGYLYQKKGDQIGFIDQLLVPKFKGSDRFRFNKKVLKNHNHRCRINGERIMVSALGSVGIIKELMEVRRELQALYAHLRNQLQSTPKLLNYLDEFYKLNSTTLFYVFKFLAYAKFFNKHKFEKIITTDENSPNFKIILDAAKKNGMFTIGYQHGSIHELHPAYVYSVTDMKRPPVPDITITWGEKWTQLLRVKGNYDVKKVISAGQIRTDVIKYIKKNQELSKASIIPGLGSRSIVLFATQPQRDPVLRYKAAEDVVLACKNMEHIHLVFKLHPRENDPEFYNRIAQKHNLTNYTISKNEELYIILHSADVVITCFSTVGSEALYFNKPLIILDHLGQDVLGYHKDGVAFQAKNASDLTQILQEVLSGKLVLDKKVLGEYLKQSTYAIDGKVAERVWASLNAIGDPQK